MQKEGEKKKRKKEKKQINHKKCCFVDFTSTIEGVGTKQMKMREKTRKQEIGIGRSTTIVGCEK